VVCIADDKIIHLFMLQVADIRTRFEKVQHGYRLLFSQRHLQGLIALPCVDYSSWSNESIGCRLFA